MQQQQMALYFTHTTMLLLMLRAAPTMDHDVVSLSSVSQHMGTRLRDIDRRGSEWTVHHNIDSNTNHQPQQQTNIRVGCR